ncbi:MAG: acetoacetate--CoA ligase [Alphaproteobacteria bacterium]|nr:acetoacetate--CoA ligase [Alphaproteobacteria bacterium]
MTEPLWTPSEERVATANLTRFIAEVNAAHGLSLSGYGDLWRWSVENLEDFWTDFWDFAGIVSETRGARVLIDGDKMPGAQFFPDARLNFAENLLRRRDDGDAIVFRAEDKVRRRMSWRDLHEAVSRLAQALKAAGVEPGDRVAGYVPNMPETTVAMLAASAIGAIWTSCSPDFGERGVLDRFGQSKPKVLFAADGYFYNGKSHSSLAKLPAILAELPSVERVVILPLVEDAPDVSGVRDAMTLADFIADHPAGEVPYERLPFNHPLFIMYSSGTTGAPKCITHSAGGVLLNQVKEHLLQCDEKPGDRVFYFTTCGWMMWNWLQTALAAEATLMLYDGSPFAPDGNVLFDFAAEEKWTLFGTSAKYLDALAKGGYRPKDTHDLASLRTLCSTGSPLAPEGFDYVYDAIKTDAQLASIAGGTDLLGCFMAGDPTGPVYRGEIQRRCLAMAVDVFDEHGNPVRGAQGELVCTRPFPSMPIGFWGDETGERYRSAYFEAFPNVWTHGDYVELTEHDGMVVYGRSDATLNPGGVRIGTAEIYRQVESFEEVLEAIVIGQQWDNDVRVVLFVRLQPGHALTDALVDAIKKRVRSNCTPRHVPAKVIAVADIPRTRSGKITELAVRDVVHGRAVKNKEALANPEALALYEGIPELQE